MSPSMMTTTACSGIGQAAKPARRPRGIRGSMMRASMARITTAARPTQSRYWPAKNARSVNQRGRNRAWPGRAGNRRSSGQMTNARMTRLTPAAHAEAARLEMKAAREALTDALFPRQRRVLPRRRRIGPRSLQRAQDAGLGRPVIERIPPVLGLLPQLRIDDRRRLGRGAEQAVKAGRLLSGLRRRGVERHRLHHHERQKPEPARNGERPQHEPPRTPRTQLIHDRRDNVRAGGFHSPLRAGAARNGYSTVTDFARLRGWSTSLPLASAIA